MSEDDLGPDQIRFECGCIGTYVGIWEGYVVEVHTCDGTVLQSQKAERREARFQSRSASYQRLTKPQGSKPFRLLR